MKGRFFNGWTFLASVLVVIIIVSGITIASKYNQGQAIEISLSPTPVIAGEIYIAGEVKNPGLYPFYAGDSLEDVIRAAGGITDNADLSHIDLNIPAKGEVVAPQKVNINTAAAWLLAALPGIGDVRAKAIVDYRHQNGPFRDTNELLKVAGIGDTTLKNIKHLITVGD